MLNLTVALYPICTNDCLAIKNMYSSRVAAKLLFLSGGENQMLHCLQQKGGGELEDNQHLQRVCSGFISYS